MRSETAKRIKANTPSGVSDNVRKLYSNKMSNKVKLKTLFLSLKKDPFEVMITGEKNEEFRENSQWIASRLFDPIGREREYDLIKFVHGYGSHRPYFICKYNGFIELYQGSVRKKYSNGLIAGGEIGDFVILCGEIIETGNLKVQDGS